MGKKNHHGGEKGTKFKFNSRDLDIVFPNRTDHYFPQEILVYTKEGKNICIFLKGSLSRLVNSNKIYVLLIVMFE